MEELVSMCVHVSVISNFLWVMFTQLGLPMEKAQYVHRLGRTARAGKSGKGLIILGDFEAAFLKSLSDLPITEAPRPSADTFAGAEEAVEAGLAAVQYESKAQVGISPQMQPS